MTRGHFIFIYFFIFSTQSF